MNKNHSIFAFFCILSFFYKSFFIKVLSLVNFFSTFAPMKIHIFNPEHDIALAADNIFWTAPHAGRQLRSDLGWIPALWAEDGDIIVVDDISVSESAIKKFRYANKNVHCTTMRNLPSAISKYHSGYHPGFSCHEANASGIEIQPWGWDKSIVHQLKRSGIPCTLIPSDAKIATQREISDRATSSQLLRFLRDRLARTRGEAYTARSTEEIEEKLKEWGRIVIKSPWSSSGRGVRYMSGKSPNAIKWAEKTIGSMGHIMIEPYLNKTKDFGMEFTALPDGSIRYDGLSVFSTMNGAYTGNMLMTESEKETLITQYVSKQLLSDTQALISEWMKQRINLCYTGPFGIDMMIISEAAGREGAAEFFLDPCVEINLRRTMGHVALAISPKDNDLGEIMRISYEEGSYHIRIANNHEILF